ncbi:MAG: AbrB family transcriptional regulator [Oscillospiraceae bacterium]|jgi:antitoxin component of MazEF toxin-antitoxin module|nr:AbrB family transcriptional regulator [Oscillospiraceae bacterium]
MYQQITQWGNSAVIRLPKKLLDTISVEVTNFVEVVGVKDAIIIRKAPVTDTPVKYQHKTIQERFSGYTGGYYLQDDLDWGEDVGDEVLT